MREGWDCYHKAGQILSKDETNEEWDADWWAQVRINFASSDGTVSGAYV